MNWWANLPATREFFSAYSNSPPDAQLEIGKYTDGSVRLNLLGASVAPALSHERILQGSLLRLAERANGDSMPFHVGLRITPPDRVEPELYLVTVQQGLPTWLSVPERWRENHLLAMVGVSESGMKAYVVASPEYEHFDLTEKLVTGCHVTQLCQLGPTGEVRKRYLDIRPFHSALATVAQEYVGLSPRSDLPYGVIARDNTTWGFYAPVRWPDETSPRLLLAV